VLGDAGVDRAVGAELDSAVAGFGEGVAIGPHRLCGGDVVELEVDRRPLDKARAG
jgi:hypothetical protein